MHRVWSQGMAWSTFLLSPLFKDKAQKASCKIPYATALWLQLELCAWPTSPLGVNQQQLHCSQWNYSGGNQVTGICSLATPALPSFAKSLLVAAQLPITWTSTFPEQPCWALPSRQRGKEEKMSQNPLTPKCKQPCHGVFVKSWRLQSRWVRFSKGKALNWLLLPEEAAL